jgi:hypothetical protein
MPEFLHNGEYHQVPIWSSGSYSIGDTVPYFLSQEITHYSVYIGEDKWINITDHVIVSCHEEPEYLHRYSAYGMEILNPSGTPFVPSLFSNGADIFNTSTTLNYLTITSSAATNAMTQLYDSLLMSGNSSASAKTISLSTNSTNAVDYEYYMKILPYQQIVFNKKKDQIFKDIY